MPAVLRRAGLPAILFEQERICVPMQERFSPWRAIAEVAADPGIGLTMGCEPRMEQGAPTAIAAIGHAGEPHAPTASGHVR